MLKISACAAPSMVRLTPLNSTNTIWVCTPLLLTVSGPPEVSVEPYKVRLAL
jgi:hypothetical protein